MSAVSEYGFEIDFPLTPTLWLVIAICAVVGATARAGLGNHFDYHAATAPAAIHVNVTPASVADNPKLLDCAVRGARAADRTTAPVVVHPDSKTSASRLFAAQLFFCAATSAAMPALILLLAANPRGPPFMSNKNPCLFHPARCEQRVGLGRPAWHVYSASPSFQFHFPVSCCPFTTRATATKGEPT
jgi:hypothetical protein